MKDYKKTISTELDGVRMALENYVECLKRARAERDDWAERKFWEKQAAAWKTTAEGWQKQAWWSAELAAIAEK